ncbi:MAG: 2-dehydropantoate 2-reductase [Actinobacteria bacterium]|nr:2-dehydropantoate 2-reductase [Actinomycetota bacterium]
MTRVCVAGVGVIGSLFAAHLSRVAEVSTLTRREEHARVLREQGLHVSGRAEFTGTLDAATTPADLPEPELVIVACKGTDLDSIAARLQGFWPDATLMTVQNGIGADEVVGRYGDWKLLTAVTFMSGTRHADTHVQYVLDTATWIGPARGTTPADAQAAAALIESSGLRAEAFDDLRPAQWSKLIFNATVNTVAALTGLPHDPHFAAIVRPEDLGRLVRALMDEGKAVAAASGVTLRDDPWEMNVLATQRGSAHYPSMLEDVDAKRRTEIDMITGALVRAARQAGVPVPLHETMFALIKGKEASWE